MTAGVCEAKTENGTLFSDDSSCGGSVEVIGDGHKGFRNDGRIVECSGLGTNLIVFAKNDEVNGVNEEVIVKIESIVNHPVINGGSQESLNDEIGQVNELQNMVVETVEADSSPQPLEDSKSQGTISQLLSTSNSNVIKTVEDLGLTHDPVENRDTKLMVADSLDHLEPQLSDFVEEDDAKSEEQTENTECIESDVKLQDLNKEDVEVTCDDKESQTVVAEKVHDALSPEDDAKPLEETEAINDPITNEITVSQIVIEFPEVKEAPVVPVLNFSDTCVSPEVMVVDSLDSTRHEPQLSDIVEEDDAKSEEQMEDKPTEDTEFVESEVKLQDLNKEDVEVTYDDKESETVVTELSPEDDEAQTTNEAEQPLEETEAINDPITDEITVSQTVIEFPEVRDDKQTEFEAKEAPVAPLLIFSDTCVSPEAMVADSLDSTGLVIEDLESHLSDTELVESNVKLQHLNKEKTETVNDHITNESAISQIEVADVPILIFPDTFVSPEIKIQFGSLGCQKKDHTNDPETVLDDLQENRSGEKVVKDMEDVVIPMSSGEVPSEFVDAEIEDADSDIKIDKVEDVIQEILCSQVEIINQLKSYGDELVSNMESHDEIQQRLNQKNQTQEHTKGLKKELNPLEDSVSKPEPEVASLETRRTNEENEKGKEPQTPFKAADETKSISVVSTVGKKTVSFAEKKDSDYQTMKKVAGRFNQMNKTKESVKFLIKDSMFACLNEIVDDEENEFDKNSDKLREEETECKLKDQIRLREKKRANEKKDKVREKRFRKREKKRTHGDIRTNDEKIVKSTETNIKIKVIIALALIVILIYLSNM